MREVKRLISRIKYITDIMYKLLAMYVCAIYIRCCVCILFPRYVQSNVCVRACVGTGAYNIVFSVRSLTRCVTRYRGVSVTRF